MQLLTFVSMRLETPQSHGQKGETRRDEGVSIRSTITNVMGGGALANTEISQQLARQLFECLAICTMQFRGYIHMVRETQARTLPADLVGSLLRVLLEPGARSGTGRRGQPQHACRLDTIPTDLAMMFASKLGALTHEAYLQTGGSASYSLGTPRELDLCCQGYELGEPMQGSFGAAFRQSLDAVRFAHAAQVRLMYISWHNAGKDLHCGPMEFTPDGRLLFFGPRVAMAVHETSDFECALPALKIVCGILLSSRVTLQLV